jgi:hypothetical protein
MRLANQDADDHAARVCVDSAYSLVKRNDCFLDSANVGGVRVEFFVYNATLLYCRISFSSETTERTGYCDPDYKVKKPTRFLL